ncbi:hypothetical protein HI914_03959 [Erysiphe necator]|nr:hypothetical protein HI914_03959 [Erysiphe necator]
MSLIFRDIAMAKGLPNTETHLRFNTFGGEAVPKLFSQARSFSTLDGYWKARHSPLDERLICAPSLIG